MGRPEYVCHAVPRSNHVRRQMPSLTPAALIDSDASRRSLRHVGSTIDPNEILLIGLMTYEVGFHDRPIHRCRQQRSRHGQAMPILVLNWR
jgi:hypothetical protein